MNKAENIAISNTGRLLKNTDIWFSYRIAPHEKYESRTIPYKNAQTFFLLL